MLLIDWIILAIYLLITLVLGVWLAQRNRTQNDYFLAGQRLTGWLAGSSMAATTFSIDTPLYVAGLIGARGLAGNWEWWSFGLAHVAMAVVFAPLWRRTGVLTDAAFTELRYGGSPAAWLRGVKAFLLAVPVNCIGIGYAFLALRKVAEALGIVTGQLVVGAVSDSLLLLIVVSGLILIYTVIGGLWAVVITDLVQLGLALLGALAVAIASVHAAGGIKELLISIEQLNRPELLSMFPWTWNREGFQWLDSAGISLTTFTAFISLQWWSFRRSDGGGEFIQRMLATRNEGHAELAGWVFLIINYFIRSWLWIIVALSALVLLPGTEDWEMSYPILALEYLPPVALGLVVVSLVAAFMSTVSTGVNWGAGYLTHDLYQRFLRPNAGQRELVLIGQLTTAMLLFLGVLTAMVSDSIGTVFRLVIAIGSGPGIVLVLRWFWWRINAATELAAMVSGFVVGVLTSVSPLFRIDDYGMRLFATTGFTAICWLVVLCITPPESSAVLEGFVRKVRPPGPGWRGLRKKLKLKEEIGLSKLAAKFVLSTGVLFGGMLGLGAFLLHQQIGGWIGLVVCITCLFCLNKFRLSNFSLVS